MKRGTPDHPKTVDLASRLNIPRYQAVGILECLWHFTAEFAPQGNIGKFSDAAIAGHLHWDKPCRELITALCEAKFVERHPKHRLIVHDWQDHADQTVKRYLLKHGLEIVRSEQVTRKPRASTKLANASTKLANANDNEGLASQPLPLPLPLPQPLPEPSHATAGFDFSDWFERQYSRHPKKRDKGLAERYAVEALPKFDPGEFERVHKLWCATTGWRKEQGSFAPPLAQWILDEGWRYEPHSAPEEPVYKSPYRTADEYDRMMERNRGQA